MPFRAETAAATSRAPTASTRRQLRSGKGLPPRRQPVNFEPRALYNQAFESVYAMVPGDIMLLLMLIPSMLTALSVVREKELGSIANFYAAPATRREFLLGKQLPYVVVSLIQFATLVALAVVLFHVPIKGSLATLVLGAVMYVLASTGFGLLMSVFAATQTAAIFAAAIITILPADPVLRHVRADLIADGRARRSRRRSSPAPTSRRSASAPSPRRWVWRRYGPTWSRWLVIAVVYFGASVMLAEEAGDLSHAKRLAHLPAWHQGADQPGAGPRAAVPDRLRLHLRGLHAGEERGDGRGQCLDRDRQRGRFAGGRAIDARCRCCRRSSCRRQNIAFSDINRDMDAGRYTFVVEHAAEIPGRIWSATPSPQLQIVTDATAMSQAGRGPGYIQQIITRTIDPFWSGAGQAQRRAAGRSLRPAARFNPNMEQGWFVADQPDHQQHLGAGDLPDRRRGAARARARQPRASAGHAAAPLSS